MMKSARIGALLLVASAALPGTSFAQLAAPDAEPAAEPAIADVAIATAPVAARVESAATGTRSATSAMAGVIRDDGAIDMGVGPRATQPRFGEYTIAPAQTSEFASSDDVAALRPVTRGQATALMIAGAALLVTGLIIGDDAGTFVAVLGAGVGAYGVYLYFR